MARVAKSELKEFKSSDGQSETPDPVDTGSTKRPADQETGEKEIPSFATKAEAIGSVVDALSGFSKEQIGDVFKGMTEKLGLSPEKAKATRRLGTAQDAAEAVNEIFGDELTEENRLKAATIFEAAVNTRIASDVARLEEQFDEQLAEAIEDKIDGLSESIDKYLSYAVEVWAEENKLAIENGLKAEVTESFLVGLKNLFLESHIDIPTEKVDIVTELTQKVTELENKVNEVVSENVDLKDEIDTAKAEKIFVESVADLPATQQDKMKTLVEGLEYENAEDFSKKISVIKESYFKKSSPSKVLIEDVDNHDGEVVAEEYQGAMAHYVKALDNK